MMGVTTSKLVSRRRQPDKNPALSRDEIVRAALEYGSREGFEQLSMRSLARDLDVTPMALYHHVADKQELLSILVDEVLAPIEVPEFDFGTWQERLTELQRSSNESSDRYPGIDLVASSTKVTAQGERIMRGYVQILRDGGFSEREAMLGLCTITTLRYGSSLANRQFRGTSGPVETNRTDGESPTLVNEWRDLLKNKEGRESVDQFAQMVILAGLEAIKGTMSDEDA